MHDDPHNQKPPQTDGWLEDYEVEHVPVPPPVQEPPPSQLPAPRANTTPTRSQSDDVEDGKALALLSHAGLLFGIPVFIIPMMQKDNHFALHHSKAAAVNFIMFIIATTLTVITCGLAFPLIFVCYIPAIVGIIHAANGEPAGAWGWGNVGESLFSGLQVPPDDPRQLPE